MTCWERGKVAEKLFAEMAELHGYAVTWATAKEDQKQHKDLKITRGRCDLWVDVKARKRINRADDDAQDDWLLLELHGAGKNNNGWLYGSQADLIAQEVNDSFLIFSRVRLIDYIEQFVDVSQRVSSSTEAKYKVHNRRAHDLFTWVTRTHLCQFPGALRRAWPKPEPRPTQITIHIHSPEQLKRMLRLLVQVVDYETLHHNHGAIP